MVVKITIIQRYFMIGLVFYKPINYYLYMTFNNSKLRKLRPKVHLALVLTRQPTLLRLVPRRLSLKPINIIRKRYSFPSWADPRAYKSLKMGTIGVVIFHPVLLVTPVLTRPLIIPLRGANVPLVF